MPMTEHELDTLLRDYGGAVRGVCRAILPGHPQDAEEAEADTFYKLWRGARLPADEAHRRRLVVLTARQCAIDRYRALLRNVETAQVFEKSEVKVWECRNCGHIVVGTAAPEVCPTCNYAKSFFEIHSDNY